MSIRARIMALVACFALMALVVTGLGLATIADYNRMMKDYGRAYENAWRGERLNHLVSNVVMESRGVYIARNREEMDTFVTGLATNLDEIDDLIKTWKADSSPQELRGLQPILNDTQTFLTVRRPPARTAPVVQPLGQYARAAEQQHRIDDPAGQILQRPGHQRFVHGQNQQQNRRRQGRRPLPRPPGRGKEQFGPVYLRIHRRGVLHMLRLPL